ncbi:Zn-ribbon domain-containing protein [Bradyrhizobium quebecense]|uniref:Zn-ribbon domain-containing protein n=2 Tax=Bradyrhizobium quebecense TaxID=2748629 RepID=A0ACD3VAS4_9BRAD|nr:Zn-ribbon domain-containing protein [Bradyrhizobium quebecense]UGY03285.1 Zn-ribbon domain-containing protein [Bradyrhizobium quebecense]
MGGVFRDFLIWNCFLKAVASALIVRRHFGIDMEDSVQIRCTRCKNVFRDRAKRLQNGYSRQCPSCEIVLFFDEDSHDSNIKRAMRTARRARKELRESEGVSTRRAASVPRQYSGRSASNSRGTEEDDAD